MKETRLIIVSGMSGVGKSTTTQRLATLCKMNDIDYKWYHEEMDEHPIRWADGGEFQAGPLNTREGMKVNIEDVFQRWSKLIKKIKMQGGLHLMEGCLYQSIIRYFFSSPLSRQEIIDYYLELMKLLAPVNPHIIFLYRPNVKESFEKAFKIRGDRWKNIILDSKDDPYFKTHAYVGDESVYGMEADYQGLAHHIFNLYEGPKIDIDTSKELWDDYLKAISDFLALDYHPIKTKTVSNLSKYCGKYAFKNDNNEPQSIDVIQEDNHLYARFSWFKYVKMNLNDNDMFELAAFPIYFKYRFDDSDTYIEVSGNYGWDIIGKTLIKVKHE
jgi:hypothetical protein